jgi:hypothetical protein
LVNVHAGLDLSRRKIDVCLISSDGEVVGEFARPCDHDGLRQLVERVGLGVRVRAVIESMSGARFVHDTLEEDGLVEQVGTGVWALTEVGVQRLREDAELSDYG